MNLFGFERIVIVDSQRSRHVGYKAPNGVTLGSVGEVKQYLIDKGSIEENIEI